nr:hypothetical protein [Tanacetum cinerariifolium]
MFDCDEMFTSEIDESLPPSPIYDRYQSGDGYHVVPPLYTGTFMPPKSDLVFHNAPNVNETVHTAFNVELSPTKLDNDLSHTHNPLAPIITDWISDSEDDFEDEIPQNAPIFVQPTKQGNPQHALKDKGVIDSGCSRHMTWNMSYLSDFEELNGGYVLWCVSQMCDKKNNILFTDIECPVLSPEFKLPDENQVLLRATLDESNLWHRRLGHINFKIMNKLVKGNLVRGLPSKVFENDHTCVAYKKGKQHRASCKTKPVSSVNQPQQRSHMDLFGPTFVKSLNKKSYCLVATNDYSRFTWMFFLATKDETSLILLWDEGDTEGVCMPRTPQQNDITERKNTTLIEAARTMLADLLLPIPFWAEEPEFEGRKPQSEVYVSPSNSAQAKKHDDKSKRDAKGKSLVESSTGYRNLSVEFEDFSDNSINEVNAAGPLVPAVGQISTNSTNTFSVVGPSNAAVKLEDITYSGDEEDVGAEADFTNLETTITGELLQFKMQKVWVLVDLPNGKRAIGNKRVFRTKKDERCIVVKNKARLVAQGHTQEEGINYEEVFAPVARIEAIRLFLAYASFMGFMVYQMNVKSAFLYGTIKEEVYACQPLGFEDPDYPDKVYKVVKAIYRLHQAPRACQDKYVAEILRKFGLTDGKLASTPIDTEKPLLKDLDGEDVDVHTYRSMIGSLMYLTSSRSDIMFAVCACACFQVTPKASHLHVVKRIFRYLKGKPHLGLWYPKDLPFNLVAYSDSDYAGASLDRKSTNGRCQFLGCRLISWQCKKQTVVATSSTKAEYVAAASCCVQVLWIQN